MLRAFVLNQKSSYFRYFLVEFRHLHDVSGKAQAQLSVPAGIAGRARRGKNQWKSSRHGDLQSDGQDLLVIMLLSGPRGKSVYETCFNSWDEMFKLVWNTETHVWLQLTDFQRANLKFYGRLLRKCNTVESQNAVNCFYITF